MRDSPKLIKLFIIIIISLIIFIASLLLVIRYLSVTNKLIEEIVSPNGQYVAVIFEVDRGALGSSFALEIIKNGEKLSSFTNGNTFRSRYDFSAHWIDDNTLHIGNGSSDIYMQKTSIRGIKIEYNKMKK